MQTSFTGLTRSPTWYCDCQQNSIQPVLSNLDSVLGGHNIEINRDKTDESVSGQELCEKKISSGELNSSHEKMSESVSLESLNSGSSSGDHHIGINKDQPTISAHHRRTTLLKPEMYNNEAEFNEQMSFKNNEIPVGEPGEDNLASMSQNGGSGFWNCHFSDYKSAAHRFMIWMSHLCVFVYVISAIIFWKFQEDRCLKWCDGLGMLIIIVVLIYSGLAYFHIKSHYGNALYNNVFKLVHRWLSPAMEHRYRKTVICFLPFIAIGVFLGIDTIGDSERLISCLGIVVIMGLGFVFSKSRSQIQWYPVLSGLLIQFLLGLVTIRWSIGRNIFHCIGDRVVVFLDYSNVGARFVYGSDLIDKGIFAFQSMSSVFFLSLVVHILYYYGIMQWIVLKIGWLIQVLMGTTVCESVNAAASVFLGISQGPLLLKPYLNDLTKSEMHAIMTAGFGTIAGTVFAAYINYGISSAHLITASVMSAPAALCYSKLFYPETEESKNKAENITLEKGDEYGVLDAATKGTMTALQLVLAIIANIIGFLSFITFVNGVLSWLGILVGIEGLTSEYLMGKVLIPLAWVIGVEWKECEDVAQLIGVKTVINEFVAYGQLGKLKLDKKLSPRSEMIATYALCGYSNFGAIAISIGSLIPLAPSQRKVITEVAFRAFIAGSATCFLTACIAGMLMPSHYVLDNTTQVHNASTEVP